MEMGLDRNTWEKIPQHVNRRAGQTSYPKTNAEPKTQISYWSDDKPSFEPSHHQATSNRWRLSED